jgi:hypothetical protein
MSFFSHVGSFFKKLFGSEASLARTATVSIAVIAPLLETALAVTVGEPAAAAVQAGVTIIQNDLAAASATISQAGPNPTAISFLNSAKTNMQQLLTAAEIKDPQKLATFTTTGQTIISELEAIIEVFTPAPAAPAAPAKA